VLCGTLAVASPNAYCQSAGGIPASTSTGAVALIDSTGKVVGHALTETVVLVTLQRDVTAPASIRAVYDNDNRIASGLASWQSGGSVLFTSPDCTNGAYVHGGAIAGVRAATQVQTREGIVLFAGAIGMPTTVEVRSILYDTGCSPIAVRQSGLFPALATLNLSATYPSPLSFR
jgi:hypothetical protein